MGGLRPRTPPRSASGAPAALHITRTTGGRCVLHRAAILDVPRRAGAGNVGAWVTGRQWVSSVLQVLATAFT
eukprot:5187691-Alexandrium_andersonii.AAC.1